MTVDPWDGVPTVTAQQPFGDIPIPSLLPFQADEVAPEAAVDPPLENAEGIQSVADTNIVTYGLTWLLSPFAAIVGCRCVQCSGPRRQDTQVWDTSDLTWWDFQRRRITSLWLAKAVYERMKEGLAKYDALEAHGKVDEAEQMWHEIACRNATEVRTHAEECKGMFVKATQQMSTMHGVLPDIYLEEFTKTTEALPVSTAAEVYRVIERGLGKPPKELFSAFDRSPVASASIGQVHKANIDMPDGRQHLVAVKVQHDGVDAIFTEDLKTLAAVAEQVAYWAPELDFRKGVAEFEEVIPRELDFVEEMDNLVRARKALRQYGSPVIVPSVHESLCCREVLTMDFIEAIPITRLCEDEFCAAYGLNKNQVMRELLEAFALLVFREGLIHGDPHAGNIRLKIDRQAPGGAVAVIFDWGMTRSMTNSDRLSLAKFFHALSNMDLNGVFEALDFLGFEFDSALMTDALMEEVIGRLRASMKDTISKEATKKNTQNVYREIRAKKKEIDATGVDVSSILQNFPKSIVFFLRMCECMRGLCVACECADLPVLEIFSSNARASLKAGSGEQSLTQSLRIFTGPRRNSMLPDGMDNFRSTSDVKVPQTPERANVAFPATPTRKRKSFAEAIDSSLQHLVLSRLERLTEQKKLIGAQVAVIQDGNLVCDIAFGTLSTIDMRPVQSSTRFPLMGATAGVASLALLRTLSRGCFSSFGSVLDTPVSTMWPTFARGMSNLTLRKLLSHSAGLQSAFPDDFGPQYLNDPSRVHKHFEEILLSETNETRYAYMLQTFFLARFGKDLAPKDSLQAWIRHELSHTGLDIAGPRGGEAAICRDIPRLSRVSMVEVEHARHKRSGTIESLLKRNSQTMGASLGLIDACLRNPLPFDPLQANVTTVGGSSGSRESPFRAGLCLGASAKGMAKMLASKDIRDDLQRLGALEPSGDDNTALGWFLTGGATSFTSGGMQTLEVSPIGWRAMFSHRRQGFGIVCGLGPCVMTFPDICDGGVTISIMVNDVLHGREVATELTSVILEHYGFAPAWTRIPLRVLADAGRLAAKHAQLLPLLQMISAGSEAQEEACWASAGKRLLSCAAGAQKVCCSKAI